VSRNLIFYIALFLTVCYIVYAEAIETGPVTMDRKVCQCTICRKNCGREIIPL